MPRNSPNDKPPSSPAGRRISCGRSSELFWSEFNRLNSPELGGCYSRLYLRARRTRGRITVSSEHIFACLLGLGNVRPWRRIRAALAATGHLIIIDDRTIEVPAALSPARTRSSWSV